MAGQNIGNFAGVFRHYLKGVTPTLRNTVVGRKFARNDYKWTGDHIRQTVHLKRNVGHGNITDGGAFPAAGNLTMGQATAYRRFNVSTCQASDGLLATAATSEYAAQEASKAILRDSMEGAAQKESFEFYRDGTGVIGRMGTDVTTTTWGATDARLLWDDLAVEVYNNADLSATGLRGTMTISSVARALDANGDFAVTSAAAPPSGTAATDYLVWPGSLNRCVTGLQALVNNDTGTFQGINCTTYPRYTSVVLANSSVNRALSPTLFRQMLAAIKQESGSPAQVTVLSNTWQGVNLEELYEGELRLTPDDEVGGASVASFQSVFGKIKLVTDPMAPYNQMFFVDFSQIYRAVQSEMHWRTNGDGGGPFYKSQTSAVYRAELLEICEYFIKQRNKCGRLDDLSETVVTAY